MTTTAFRRMLFGVVFAAAFAARADAGAQQSSYNPRDDQYRYLGMMRARAEFQKASDDYDRARELSARGMLSPSDLSERKLSFERVRVDYLQQSLAALLAATHLSILQATKERRPDGSLSVAIRLQSVSARSAADEKARPLIDSSLEAALRPDVIPSVFVSLKSETGASGVTISKPYERQISELKVGQESTIRFALLKDVTDVVVSLAYGDKTEERRVWLDNAGSAGSVSIRAAQFSLEGDFGTPVTYDLTLERTDLGSAPLRLAIEGLPAQVRFEFRDTDSKARIGQVRFPDGQSVKRLQLVVNLPPAADEEVAAGKPLKFIVTAGASVAEAASASATSRATMELIPHGVARVELRTTSLYFESAPGDSVVTEVAVRNAGSGNIQNVAVVGDPATGWTARALPATIPELALGESRTVHITFVPKAGSSIGDYEHRLRVVSRNTDKRLDDEDKIIRIKVAGRYGAWMTFSLLAALAAMTAVIVFASRRLGVR